MKQWWIEKLEPLTWDYREGRKSCEIEPEKEFRGKYGDTKDKVPINCCECDKEHDGCVTEKNTAVQNRTES